MIRWKLFFSPHQPPSSAAAIGCSVSPPERKGWGKVRSLSLFCTRASQTTTEVKFCALRIAVESQQMRMSRAI
ncbi:hypothetical protein BS50DRAFT_370513 [Corynespora cassiicola Philippines]|uniref:Uncharacterized protein n=1 Tax=Corynespora cassiicola Philippines TaxID=1448308 RepID=A0A2T2NMI9_CORCC|nr:hypothetical protein BS50DRAFT_370513 [Corynespora cassiicola Philippines]